MIEGDFQAPNWLDLQRLHHNQNARIAWSLLTSDTEYDASLSVGAARKQIQMKGSIGLT